MTYSNGPAMELPKIPSIREVTLIGRSGGVPINPLIDKFHNEASQYASSTDDSYTPEYKKGMSDVFLNTAKTYSEISSFVFNVREETRRNAAEALFSSYKKGAA